MHRHRLVSLIFVVMLVGAACSGGAPSPSPSSTASAASPGASGSAVGFQPPNLAGKKVIIVVNGDIDISKVVVAHAYNLLKQWGADVTVNYGGTSQVSVGAMVSGQADVLQFSAQGTLSAINSGVQLKTFAVAQPRQDYAMIGRPNIKTLADLKGAKIGVLDDVGLNGVQATLALQAAGLTQKDVSIIQAGGQGARVSAMVAGRIDATMVSFSAYLTLKSQGYNLLYSYTHEQPNLYDDMLWATPNWLSKNADVAVAINEALLESYRWFDNPANKQAFVQEAMADVKGMDATVASQMYDVYQQNNMYPPNQILTNDALAFNQAAYVKAGSLPKALPISQVCDPSFAQQALRAVGQQ